MSYISLEVDGEKIRAAVYEYDTIVVGSGAAGYNCAHTLATLEKNNPKNHTLAIVTEGKNMGTSRNTGSDKQTYYKLSTTAQKSDCALDMAKDLFAGGSMHGDIALTEALSSLRAFYKLVNLGVPFPHSEYGEYTGYKTDHDEKNRATSCGPLTSKFMTEHLEAAANDLGVPTFDGYRTVGVIEVGGHARGVCAVSENEIEANKFGFCIFCCANVVYAVGGPSAVYESTVYPESQTCALGAAFLAGAEGVNLTESQYGIASVKFRWNLSGSYQQVIPRYFSVDDDGVEREFLYDYFTESSAAEIANATFLLGYQWPFDPRKIRSADGSIGSSAIDLAVFCETSLLGRRVYMDFTKNPRSITADSAVNIGAEAFAYLQKSDAIGETPIARLRRMNEKAYQLYLANGIDLERDMLEIKVCAQHCNGGLAGDIWYESTSLKGFYPVGEVNGVFGVRRPGGSALNSTQVGSMRAAQKIHASHTKSAPAPTNAISSEMIPSHVKKLLAMMESQTSVDVLSKRKTYGRRMSDCGSFIRNADKITAAIESVKRELDEFFADESNKVGSISELKALSINYDIQITQYVMLSAICEYIRDGGKSRGSYIITDAAPDELVRADNPPLDEAHFSKLCYASLNADMGVEFRWETARPVPEDENWFETIMRDFQSK